MSGRHWSVASTAALAATLAGLVALGAGEGHAEPRRPRRVKLARVVHGRKARGLPAAARKRLAEQHSVVVKGEEEHFFSLYDRNAYEGLPSFVTVDAVLHLAHVRLDAALADAEREVALPALRRFAQGQLQAALRMRAQAPADPRWRRLLLMHAVPAVLLDPAGSRGARPEAPEGFPADLVDDLLAEAQRVRQGKGQGPSPVCPRLRDYGMLTPRGHYGRYRLRPYFRARAYYSLCALDLGRQEEAELALDTLRLLDDAARGELGRLQRMTAALAGAGEDVGPLELAELAGTLPPLPKPVPDDVRVRLRANLAKRRAPAVAEQGSVGEAGRHLFRLLPQAVVPDSILFSRTTRPGLRPYPSALDVLAALGSQDALGALAGSDGGLPAPVAEALAARPDLGAGGLYGRWLGALGVLVREAPAQPPAFMRSPAWARHQTVAAAASWAELRHDTLLYVKQPIVWAQGGHDEELPASRAGGYVEPRPDVYRALEGLLQAVTVEFPEARPGHAVTATLDLLRFLTEVARRELAGEPMLPAMDRRLRTIGSEMEELVRGRADDLPPQALVADVFTQVDQGGQPRALHVGIGAVDELWVVVPRGRKQLLTRGGVFSYYEFVGEPGERLSDRKWARRLRERPPARPDWARPLTGPRRRKPRRRKARD